MYIVIGVTKEYTDENPYRRYGEVPPPSRFNKYDQQMEEEEYDNDGMGCALACVSMRLAVCSRITM